MIGRTRRASDGASAVEFALVLPILLLFVFGVIYFGFAFNTKLTLTQAAREGARLGATYPVDEVSGDPTIEWYDAVFARIDDAAFGDTGLGNGPRQICVGYAGPDGIIQWEVSGGIAVGDCDVDLSPEVADERHVRVLVARRVPLQTIVAQVPDIRVGATAVSRYEGALPED